MSSPDVVIVGAGVVGAAAAYELARHGARVAVVERSLAASGCSYGNAGLISPSHSEALASPASLRSGLAWMTRRDSPFRVRPRASVVPWLLRFAVSSLPHRSAAASETLRRLTSASLEMHEALHRSGLDTSFRRDGIMSVYETEAAFASGCARCREADDSDARALAPEDARELLPVLAPDIAGAIYRPREAHCDPGRFVGALLDASRETGAEIRTGVEILQLKSARHRVSELQTTHGPLLAGTVVLASGVWTRRLAGDVGVAIPLEPGKGYHLEIGSGAADASVPAFLEEAHITATPLDGRLRVTGGLDLSGLDLHVDPVRLEGIARAARRTLSAAMDRETTGIWRGLRPCTPDGLPVIGPVDGIENLLIATGHAMLGIALAPATAGIITDLISGQTPRLEAEAFAPSRFRSGWRVLQNQEHERGMN